MERRQEAEGRAQDRREQVVDTGRGMAARHLTRTRWELNFKLRAMKNN